MLNAKASNVLRVLNQTITKRHKSSFHSHKLEGILGTSLELSYSTKTKAKHKHLAIVLAEIDRLEKIFSRFDKYSELNQWLEQSETLELSVELRQLLKTAQIWTIKTRMAFHPGVDSFSELWEKAERQNQVPKATDLQALHKHFKQDFVEFSAGNKVKKSFPFMLNFNGLAKGMIIDSASKLASEQQGTEDVLLNLGGDLKHISNSNRTVVVDISNPFTPQLNAKAKLSIKIKNQAVATSGASQRHYKLATKTYSQILNPRTGWPVQQLLSATVIATDCATADVLATSFNVLTVKESLELANQLPNIGCYLIDKHNQSYSNDYFKDHIVTKRSTEL